LGDSLLGRQGSDYQKAKREAKISNLQAEQWQRLAALPRERDGMVIPLSKIVFIKGQPVKLTFMDGRTWVSRVKDFKGFKKRVRREFITCQKQFNNVAARPDPG